MTLREIDNEIQRLSDTRRKLEEQEITEFIEKAKGNIGRCFIVDGRYVKVIDVPQKQHMMTGGIIFNRYQYPALYLGYDEDDSVIPFCYDTLFSGVWGDGNVMSIEEVEEISSTEFAEEFTRYIQEFKKRVSVE